MGSKRRPAPWNELKTDVVVGTSEADAIALGGQELEGVALRDPDEVIYLGFQHAYDVWRSDNGASYLCSWRDDPLFCHHEQRWSLVELGFPETRGHSRILRVLGRSGATPDDDELLCLAVPYTINETPQATLLWRRNRQWREIALPPGRPWELAHGPSGDVLVSVGDSLLRVHDGTCDVIAPPEPSRRAVGVCATHDGAIIGCFAPLDSIVARPWLLRDRTWEPLDSEPLEGWATGYIDSVTWRQTTYLTSARGIHRHGDGALHMECAFRARRLFCIGDALVCAGFDNGTYAHRIHRGDGWQPLFVPRPEVATGGRGKLALLAPRRKVPRRRIRMKRPRPAAPTNPTLEQYTERWMEQRVFRERGEPRGRPLEVAKAVRAHFGVAPAAALRRYLDCYSAYETSLPFGELGIWAPEDFAPPTADPTVEQLTRLVFHHQPTTIAALTNTLYLGADHGGQIYFAEVAQERSEVFIYGPGVGQLQFLADSLDAFLFLNDLAQQWSDYARANDVDFEDVEEGDLEMGSAQIQTIIEGMRSLEGRVNLQEDGDVISEFHELLPMLTEVRPRAASRSITERLFERAHWLIMLLGDIYVDVDRARDHDYAADMADPEIAALAATQVYWLWHLFLFDDDRLGALRAAAGEHSSSLVRATALMLADPPESVRATRDKVRAALE